MAIRILLILILIVLYINKPNTKRQKTKSTCEKSVSKAFLIGKASCLPNNLYLQMTQLNLLHLTTLSGIHLSIILSLFAFYKKLKIWVNILLIIMFYYIDGYFAFKRMLWIKLISHKIDFKLSFCLVFIFDYYIGSYFQSPLSFIYSLAFIGTLMTSKAKNNLQLCFEMSLMQIFLCFLMKQKLMILSFISNFIIIPIFNIVFPLFFLTPLFSKIDYILAQFFIKLIHFNYQLVSVLPSLKANYVLLLIALILYLQITQKKLIAVFLILISFNIDNKKLEINLYSKTLKKPLIISGSSIYTKSKK